MPTQLTTPLPFSELGLSPALLPRLEQLGFHQPTEIQIGAIPAILNEQDVLACAQTGTGKTAAFGLPILDKLLQSNKAYDPKNEERQNNQVRALILVPTRELAQQVFDNLSQYAQGAEIKILTVYGGVSINTQTQRLKQGCDLLVATPGRLLDHLFCRNVSLAQIRYLVLDEADRMLDMGFMPDIKRILKRCNSARQTLFFSATFDKRIKNIAYKLLTQPLEIEITPSNSTASSVEQMVYPVDKKRKAELLAYLIGSRNWQQVLVFTKTKQGSDALVKELKLDGIRALAINGDKSQGARQKALDDFKSGQVRALIATDVAARGLDIEQLEQVVNFDMPYKAEDYIHRIGRTGRAGHVGLAISFMSRDEEYLLQAIEELLDTKLPQEWLQGFEPSLIDDVSPSSLPRRKGRNADKRKLKAKLKIHAKRGRH